jgi:tetratricopeptide (TPR) repeat protein
VYAGLLLEYAATEAEGQAAAFHAARAAEFAPVTVPVVRGAALVLARTGKREEALALVRAMFVYEPREAAALLGRMRPVIDEDGIERALPREPAAWLAWITQLRASGDQAEADARLEQARESWPESWTVLLAATQRALGRGDWERVRSLLSPDLSIPPDPGRSILLAYRARARADSGDFQGARADARAALSGPGADPATAYNAGLALEAAGEGTEARGVWERALYALERARGDRHLQAALLASLARLEDRHGRPADALRLWRSVLEIEPRHEEARRRVDDLTNFGR